MTMTDYTPTEPDEDRYADMPDPLAGVPHGPEAFVIACGFAQEALHRFAAAAEIEGAEILATEILAAEMHHAAIVARGKRGTL